MPVRGVQRQGDEQELLPMDISAQAVREGDGEGDLAELDVNLGPRDAPAPASPVSILRRLTPRSERLLVWAGIANQFGGEAEADAADEEVVSREQWRSVARVIVVVYVCLHLLAAVVHDVRQAAPAILCAMLMAARYASRQPAVSAKLHQSFIAANRFVLRCGLGVVELLQLVLVAAALLILVTALVRRIERSIAVAGSLACVFGTLLLCPARRRRHICWRRTVAPGLALQVVLGYLVLATKGGAALFLAMGRSAELVLEFSYVGVRVYARLSATP